MSKPNDVDGLGGGEPTSLEARLARLEEILGQLEADEVELERALTLFEEGVNLVRGAERELSETALRVDELLEDGTTAPLDEDEER